MDRITEDWLPDDAPWAELTKEVLETQCAKRNLPIAGSKSTLQQRLLDYQRTNTEFRSRSWRLNPPAPDETDYRFCRKHALPIRRVRDMSDFRGCLKICFTFASGHTKHSGSPFDASATVYFTNKPCCSCGKHLLQGLPCLHVESLLRDVLNCPKPLVWQEAFMTSELEYIYNHSHAARSRFETDRYRQGKRCVICFLVHSTHERNVPCSACGMPMHPSCIKVFKKERRSASVEAGQCLLCVDKAEWAAEKYFGRPQVSPAVPVPVSVAQVSIQALARSDRRVEDGIQPSIVVKVDSVQRRVTLQGPQNAEQQRCTSTPLLGVPALIWLEGRQQQEREPQQQEQQQEQQQRQQKQKQQQQQQEKTLQQAPPPIIIPVRVSVLPHPPHADEGERDEPKVDGDASQAVALPPLHPLDSSSGPRPGSGSGSGSGSSSGSGHISTCAPAPVGLDAPVAALIPSRTPTADVQLAPSPTPAVGSSSQITVTNPATAAGSGSGACASAHTSPALGAAAPQAVEASDPVGEAAGDDAGDDADAADAAPIGAPASVAASDESTDPDPAPAALNVRMNSMTDKKSAKLARKLKRLEKKLDHLVRDADYQAKKGMRRIERVEKRIRKTEKKARKKRTLARRNEGVEDGSERASSL